jgi:CHAT domain-containing protein
LSDYPAVIAETEAVRDRIVRHGLERHPNYCHSLLREAQTFNCIERVVRDTSAPKTEFSWRVLEKTLERFEAAAAAYARLPRASQIDEYGIALLNVYYERYISGFDHMTSTEADELLKTAQALIDQPGRQGYQSYLILPYFQACSARWEGDQGRTELFANEQYKRFRVKWGKENPFEYSDMVHQMCGHYMAMGEFKPEIAFKFATEYFDINLDLVKQHSGSQSRTARTSMLNELFNCMSVVLSTAQIHCGLAAVYDNVLDVKGFASSSLLAEQIVHDHAAEFGDQSSAVRAARDNLKRQAFDLAAADTRLIDRLREASTEKDLVETRLAMKLKRFLAQERKITGRDLQHALPERAAFIDFVEYQRLSPTANLRGYLHRERHIVAFISTKARDVICVPLGRARAIRQAVSRWREAIKFDLDHDAKTWTVVAATRELTDLVWNPLLPHLEEVDSLYISPDGPLCFLSFAAFPGRTPDRYAVEEFRISYTNSGRWLYRQLQSRPASIGKGMLLCGDIDYHPGCKDKPDQELRPLQQGELLPDASDIVSLPASKWEIEGIRKQSIAHFRNSKIIDTLTGASADASRLETELKHNWRYVHFAGHGFCIPPSMALALTASIRLVDDPDEIARAAETTEDGDQLIVGRNELLLSGLVVAPDSLSAVKPGFLTGEDLASLDMRQTELVVLSWCDTGLGCTEG